MAMPLQALDRSSRSKVKPAFKKMHSMTSQCTGVMRGDIGDFLQIVT